MHKMIQYRKYCDRGEYIMLFVQNITLYWSKEGRNSKGAQVRSQFPQAYLLEPPPAPILKQYQSNPSGILMQHLYFYQEEHQILNYAQHEQKHFGKYLLEQGRTPQQVEEAISYNILNMRNRQYEFYYSDLNLKNLHIKAFEEPSQENSCENSPNHFEVTFCYYNGMPIRHGHNKDYCNPDSRFYHQDFLNETAFILKPQQYGRILWNERLTDYDTGEWYYYLHCINFFYKTQKTSLWEPAVFTRQQPDYIYKQMAQLR